jgi:hypothetical protein
MPAGLWPSPLILRCVVIGAGCGCVIGGVFVTLDVVGNYSVADVVPAMLFGMAEAAVFGGIIGSVVGLIVGLLTYITRVAIRAGADHRSS